MKTSEGVLFSYILHDTSLNTETDLEEYLNDAGIDGEKFITEMKEKIRLKIQEQLYAQGDKFRADYLDAIEEESEESEIYTGDLQFAFRKLDKIDGESIEELEKDRKKLKILKKLSEKKSRGA